MYTSLRGTNKRANYFLSINEIKNAAVVFELSLFLFIKKLCNCIEKWINLQ